MGGLHIRIVQPVAMNAGVAAQSCAPSVVVSVAHLLRSTSAGGAFVNPARPIPPTVPSVRDEAARPTTADIDAGWGFAEEAAATDGALMGKPDVALADFPPPASDAEIALLIDELSDSLCRPRKARRPSARR